MTATISKGSRVRWADPTDQGGTVFTGEVTAILGRYALVRIANEQVTNPFTHRILPISQLLELPAEGSKQ